jgi:hypothetical protein
MTSETIQVKSERRIFKFQLKERANIDFYESFQGNAYDNYQNPKSTLISKGVVNDDARRGNATSQSPSPTLLPAHAT